MKKLNNEVPYMLFPSNVNLFNTLYLNSEHVIIKDKELNTEIDISEKLDEIEKICINGIVFVRQKV